jgi:hypothetical protein
LRRVSGAAQTLRGCAGETRRDEGTRGAAPVGEMSAAGARRFSVLAAWPIAGLLALLSFLGLVAPGMYARESPAWAAQAYGQDWFDLLVAAPWIAVCAAGAAGGSYRWRVLLAGGYAYAIYELAIYAFAVHFNALFLVYCATLGLSVFAFVALAGELAETPPAVDRRGARLAGGFLVAIGVLFGALWLLEDVPALLRGSAPDSLAETGLLTNPVHVIDLAFVLPAHVLVGAWLWRGRRRGEVYGPILLAFGALMAASIGGMMLAIGLAGGAQAPGVVGAMVAVTIATAAVLARCLGVVGRTRLAARSR